MYLLFCNKPSTRHKKTVALYLCVVVECEVEDAYYTNADEHLQQHWQFVDEAMACFMLAVTYQIQFLVPTCDSSKFCR